VVTLPVGGVRLATVEAGGGVVVVLEDDVTDGVVFEAWAGEKPASVTTATAPATTLARIPSPTTIATPSSATPLGRLCYLNAG